MVSLFGSRTNREYVFPDYTQAQLENRIANAPLLGYVDAMRTYAHLVSNIDPLDLIHREDVPALNPARYGLVDKTKKYDVNGILWIPRRNGGNEEELWTLDEIMGHLRGVYAGKIAFEYMHSSSEAERLWFSCIAESGRPPTAEENPITVAEEKTKKRIHGLLVRSEILDDFIQEKFPNHKRYGLEGGESTLPAVDSLFSSAAHSGIEHIILALPHRGRLNVITELLGYSLPALFHKIKGGYEFPEELGADGDMLIHLGTDAVLEYEGAKPLNVSLVPDPSHLEAVNTIALGVTRGKQYDLLRSSLPDSDLSGKVMCVQLHGDASFAAQGVVMEGLVLSNVPHFTIGGTVHLIINNNIGYTTTTPNARSSLYCSDVGKMINAPVLHVNGDHPEDVARAMEIAFRYRQHFRKDIIVDLIVYRRLGINSVDVPDISRAIMYKKIRAKSSVAKLYEEKLKLEGVLTPATAASVWYEHKSHLETELSTVSTYKPQSPVLRQQSKGMIWLGGEGREKAEWHPATGVDKGILERVGRASVTVPPDFEIHGDVRKHVEDRLKSIGSGKGINWATGEALACGSLMLDGINVRISAQDAGQGTFAHRHGIITDQRTDSLVAPLNEELQAEGTIELVNSPLSELGVLGFEFGMSWESPNTLSIWEAQFGDFANGAQVVFDQFITSAETKWLKQSGLVVLLPHGTEGGGPEHSSARIERILLLSNDPYDPSPEGKPANVNIHVVYPTTAAQYFHLLRRQIKRNFRKPLIVAGPKSILWLPAASSTFSEFEPGTKFQPVLADPSITNPANVQRVVLCTGRLYYELAQERQRRGLEDKNDVAFIRIEELSPFPFYELKETLAPYVEGKNVREWVWCQEEPRNQGAWGHVKERSGWVLKELNIAEHIVYKGRKESATTAPGVEQLYAQQQKEVVGSVF